MWLVLALWAGGCTDPEPDAEPAAPIDDGAIAEIERIVEQGADDATGGALAWVDTATNALGHTEGLPEVDSEQDVAEAPFRIASVTKLFTAAVVLQLEEEGLLELDDPIADVLPGRAAELEFGDRITLRHALGHTSGVRDFVRDPDYLPDLATLGEVSDGAVVGACEDLATVDPLEYVAGEASFEPGAGYEYSNSGYTLVGEVVEAVTGRPLAEAYRERILDPLGLERTWLTCEEEARAELVRGYHAPGSFGFTIPGQEGEPFDVTGIEDPNLWAAGGLVSTPGDLAVFARALFTGGLFDDETTLDTMLQTSENPGYGLGVETGSGRYGHGGLAAGYGTHLHYDPAGDTVVVTMVNETSEGLPSRLGEAIGRRLDADERGGAAHERTFAPHPPGPVSLPAPAGVRDPAHRSTREEPVRGARDENRPRA